MFGYRRTMLVLGVLMAAGALACSLEFGAKEPSKPVVEILSPLNGSRVALGEEVAVQFRVVDEVGVSRVELEADGVIVAVQRSDQAQAQTSMRAMLPWTPPAPGSHTLLVYAYNTEGVVSDAVGVTIVVATSDLTPTVLSPMPTETGALPMPTETAVLPAPTETVTVPTSESPMATETTVPPTVAPPTATVRSVPPSPTPTQVSCLTITIREPSRAPALGPFGIEFDRQPAKPVGYEWIVEFRQPNAQWKRAEPVPAKVEKRGQYWMAEVQGPGEGEWHWRVCLAASNDLRGEALCCSTRKVITHGDY
jgi:hypothetical protein